MRGSIALLALALVVTSCARGADDATKRWNAAQGAAVGDAGQSVPPMMLEAPPSPPFEAMMAPVPLSLASFAGVWETRRITYRLASGAPGVSQVVGLDKIDGQPFAGGFVVNMATLVEATSDSDAGAERRDKLMRAAVGADCDFQAVISRGGAVSVNAAVGSARPCGQAMQAFLASDIAREAIRAHFPFLQAKSVQTGTVVYDRTVTDAVSLPVPRADAAGGQAMPAIFVATRTQSRVEGLTVHEGDKRIVARVRGAGRVGGLVKGAVLIDGWETYSLSDGMLRDRLVVEAFAVEILGERLVVVQNEFTMFHAGSVPRSVLTTSSQYTPYTNFTMPQMKVKSQSPVLDKGFSQRYQAMVQSFQRPATPTLPTIKSPASSSTSKSTSGSSGKSTYETPKAPSYTPPKMPTFTMPKIPSYTPPKYQSTK